MNAEAGVQDFVLIGFALAGRVAQFPEIRNTSIPNVAVASDDAGADAVFDVVKAVGPDDGLVRLAGPGRILNPLDAVVFDAVGLDPGAELALEHGDAIFDGATSEVVVEPISMAANVGDAGVKAKGFGDVEAILVVNGEADGIGKQRLSGPEIDFEAGGNLDAFLRLFPLIGGGVDFRMVRLGLRSGGDERAGHDNAHETKDGEEGFFVHGNPRLNECALRGVGLQGTDEGDSLA